jgi:serine/threonine protein kinase
VSTATVKPLSRIDRFAIQRTLGEGAEGTVYLATDTRLARPVAIKTLAREDPTRPGSRGLAPNLDEARIISTLSHPNIVPLYDAGEEDGLPYLVFEYVEGQTLAALIREHGRLEIGRAVEIAIALAQGVAYAHDHRIVHRDLKPANVMITPDGVPRLMDFGIAQRVAPGSAGPQPVVGTPSYMAPEYIAKRSYLPASDVFSLGVVLYEMITGAPPIHGSDARETVRRIVAEEFPPPSRRNGVIDEHLDNLVMKALAKDPGERFAGAAEMASALRAYLDPEEDGPQAGQPTQGTLEYLLRRIRHKGDFPALSATICAVNRASTSDREPVSVLCNSILRDFALTSRLLKIVNACALGQFGGSISTVSRAVAILGYDAVRNVSMSLVLFEHMHGRTNAAALKDQVAATYFSGLLARELHSHADLRDAEQAFICAMFHRLGKLLATFYLHDEAQIIERQMQTRGWDEARAAREVLGITYEDLGVGVGRAWNFPDEILDSMRTFTAPVGRPPSQHNEKLRLVAALANELADVVQNADEVQRNRRLADLVGRYGEATGITERMLASAVQTSADAMVRDADALGHGVARNGFLREARRWRAPAQSAPTAAATTATAATAEVQPAPDSAQLVAQTQRLVPDAQLDGKSVPAPPPDAGAPEPGRRQAALAAGVQDITNTLVGEHSLNDVLRIILETMYRAIGFHRVLLFVADARQQALRCRFGFGPDVEAIVRRGAAAPLGGTRDLFYAAVVLGADLCIEDLNAQKVRAHVPQWYRDTIGARGMVLLPIVNRKRTLGLIYADSESPEILRFSAEELGLLRTLRNQALLAMRQNA